MWSIFIHLRGIWTDEVDFDTFEGSFIHCGILYIWGSNRPNLLALNNHSMCAAVNKDRSSAKANRNETLPASMLLRNSLGIKEWKEINIDLHLEYRTSRTPTIILHTSRTGPNLTLLGMDQGLGVKLSDLFICHSQTNFFHNLKIYTFLYKVDRFS